MTVLARNKKASFNYFLEDGTEAGLVLLGSEVKALRARTCSLVDAFVCYEKGRMVLRNAHIPAPTGTHTKAHEPRRDRPILLKEREIRKFLGLIQREGVTLAVTEIYASKKWIKVKVCVARGKKKHDKRAAIKEREWGREKQRVLADKLR
ncbi:MAG: SsrA-binding protein SmpB [Alphaproteobacteria bacterium]|nr:SsrA-binding protein SmpB [Alphaproteobacteria bacterium]